MLAYNEVYARIKIHVKVSKTVQDHFSTSCQILWRGAL